VVIPGRTVSVGVRTSALTVYQRRLAVSLAFAELGGGANTEAPWSEGLAEITAAAGRLGRKRSEEQLIAERHVLEDRVRILAERDSLWHAVGDTDRDICAAIPEAYLERLARHFVRNYLRTASIDFGPGL